MNQSYETTLLGVKNHSLAAQLPSLHPRLMVAYREISSIERWDMRSSVFPHGRHFERDEIDFYQLHCGRSGHTTHYNAMVARTISFTTSPTVVRTRRTSGTIYSEQDQRRHVDV